MAALKGLAQVFLFSTGLICVYNIAMLFIDGDAWLATLYLLILLIPATSLTYLKLKTKSKKPALDSSLKWRSMLFSLQGFALACWMYDIATTFYNVDITGLAVEMNPLGWPLGILGALAYYGPTLVFSYVLLFKIKENVALYAALPITLITFGMGAMNLFAGAGNFQLFVQTASLAMSARIELLALVVGMNFATMLALKRILLQPKNALSLKTKA
jgi:hypothetical protein